MMFALPNWYSKFTDVTFKTSFVVLPSAFVRYLEADGYANLCVTLTDRLYMPEDQPSNDDDITDRVWISSLRSEIEMAMHDLGSSRVFVKLNWHAPTVCTAFNSINHQDSAWMMPDRSVACRSVDDVFSVLKSSERIVRDYQSLCVTGMVLVIDRDKCNECVCGGRYCDGIQCRRLVLCVRKFKTIDKNNEFRVFVYKNAVRGTPSYCVVYDVRYMSAAFR